MRKSEKCIQVTDRKLSEAHLYGDIKRREREKEITQVSEKQEIADG